MTGTVVPTSTNIFDPPFFQASRLTGNSVSKERRPSWTASNVMYTVISLLMDAGGIALSASSAMSTVPVCASSSIPCGADVENSTVPAGPAKADMNRARTMAIRRNSGRR